MGQALYRKYRSRSFDELVGQEHVVKTLLQAVARGDISHAYLFTGPRGTGKTSVARLLAHAINQLPYSDAPHLDIIEIDAASNRRIEDVRDLREKVHIAPASAPYKVYIIDEVHMLTNESFNALLKTLEEPPAHVVFILATTELHKLPATIISRTQRFAFHSPSTPLLLQHLRAIADKETIAIDDEALQLIAEHGDGSFRDSISLLDQVRGLAQPGAAISEQEVAELLGLPGRELITNLVSASLSGDSQAISELLRQANAQGISPASTASQLIRHLLPQAASQPRARACIDKLLLVARSSHPAASLLLALLPEVGQAAAPSTPPRAAKQRPAAPVAAAPAPKVEEAEEEIETSVPPAPAGPPPAGFDLAGIERQWGTILATVKQESPALFGILKTVGLAADSGGLQIHCKFAIHQKQLEQARHSATLSKAIAQATGQTGFAISCVVQPDVVAAEPLTAAVPLTPEANAIADIMGGGEMVQYSA